MRITEISQTKKGRLALFVDGEFLFSTSPELYAQSAFRVGDDADIAALEELRFLSACSMCKEKALSLLSYRSYTVKQLFDKLCRDGDTDAAQHAVSRMQELGLLNDEDYAVRCANDLLHLKKYSPRRIVQELRHRGIDPDLAQETVQQLDIDETQAIVAVIERKYRRYLTDEKGRNKTIQGLARLGYKYDEIRRAIREINENTGDEYEYGD